MKKVIFLTAMLVISFCVAARVSYELSEKGAIANVRLQVTDQDGVMISGARVWGGFTCGNRMDDYILVDGLTDTNGEFVALGKCNEFLRVDVTKEGYYHTEEKINFWQSKADPIVVDGKWQPYGETKTVVLKKIKNPRAVKAFGSDECHHQIPQFGQWIPFDMEISDWLPPYGKGRYKDVLLRFEKRLTEKWYDFSFSMEACFTNNPHAGVYVKHLDEYSDLTSAYFAETNANYCANYVFSLESVSKRQAGLERNQYLVFRTRTRVDADGNLLGAHYGKYCMGWRSDANEMRFGAGCFNPIENDPNIEGDHVLLYKIKGYKNFDNKK